MKLKEIYQRFRAWQLNPFKIQSASDVDHHCANCGNVFKGNYCPLCGQEHDVGPVSWKSIISEIRDNFGNGDPRLILTFIPQLFGRPGYMISDYLSGRRMVCSAPAGRLIFIAAITLLVLKFTNASPVSVLQTDGSNGFLGTILGWLSSHLEWAILIQTALLIFPTWILFRHAPKHPYHSIPEGVYIQIFMGSLVLICILLRALIGNAMLILIPFYYFVAYRQLFGYGIWDNFWRTFLCFGIIFYFFGVAMSVSLRISGEFWTEHSTWEFISMFGAFIILGIGILYLGYRISERTSPQKREPSENK